MTTKDYQCLLSVLRRRDGSPYYTGQPDGIWGPLSRKALEDFQQSTGTLPVTGSPDTATGKALRQAIAREPEKDSPEDTFWEGITYFTREEFRCKCGGRYCSGYPHPVQPLLAQLCDRARGWAGKPITVVSGLRCETHNRNCGGVANSQHMFGEAADLYFSGTSPSSALAWLQSQPEVRYAYRIQGSNNIHFDIDPQGR